jgi:hypothetical protein
MPITRIPDPQMERLLERRERERQRGRARTPRQCDWRFDHREGRVDRGLSLWDFRTHWQR